MDDRTHWNFNFHFLKPSWKWVKIRLPIYSLKLCTMVALALLSGEWSLESFQTAIYSVKYGRGRARICTWILRADPYGSTRNRKNGPNNDKIVTTSTTHHRATVLLSVVCKCYDGCVCGVPKGYARRFLLFVVTFFSFLSESWKRMVVV